MGKAERPPEVLGEHPSLPLSASGGSRHLWLVATSLQFPFYYYYYYLTYLFLYLAALGLGCCGCSLVAANRGDSVAVHGLLLGVVLSLYRAQSPGARATEVVVRGISCSVACGIFPDQGLNPCALHWEEDSYPLYYQGCPQFLFSFLIFYAILRGYTLSTVITRHRLYYPCRTIHLCSLSYSPAPILPPPLPPGLP